MGTFSGYFLHRSCLLCYIVECEYRCGHLDLFTLEGLFFLRVSGWWCGAVVEVTTNHVYCFCKGLPLN